MVSHMTTSYGPQTAQMNEEPPQESSLNLTLMQHPHDEYFKPREVRLRLEVEPLQVWYYCIFSNPRTLVINLKLFAEVFTKLKTYVSSPGLQFLVLDTIIGCTIQLLIMS